MAGLNHQTYGVLDLASAARCPDRAFVSKHSNQNEEPDLGQESDAHESRRVGVKSAALTVGQSLPVYPDNRTSSVSAATSQRANRTRNPLARQRGAVDGQAPPRCHRSRTAGAGSSASPPRSTDGDRSSSGRPGRSRRWMPQAASRSKGATMAITVKGRYSTRRRAPPCNGSCTKS